MYDTSPPTENSTSAPNLSDRSAIPQPARASSRTGASNRLIRE